MEPRFHLAFCVKDLEETRLFYAEVLGCRVGRSTDRWMDFELYGHQLSAHLKPEGIPAARRTLVDGDGVPIPHFGAVLPRCEWNDLRSRLEGRGIEFDISPRVRFEGLPGEQWTMFFKDPSGHYLEFKSFESEEAIFATE